MHHFSNHMQSANFKLACMEIPAISLFRSSSYLVWRMNNQNQHRNHISAWGKRHLASMRGRILITEGIVLSFINVVIFFLNPNAFRNYNPVELPQGLPW